MEMRLVFVAYALPICILMVQNTHIRESFSSESPWMFYLLVSIGMASLSLISTAFTTKKVTATPETNPTIGILPFCSECNLFIYPRTHHCQKCKCCVQRHVVHSELTGACIGQSSIFFVLSGCVMSVMYFSGLIVESIVSLFAQDTFFGHFLLPIVIAISIICFVQVSIFASSLLRIVMTNGIVLEVQRWWIFEVWTLQNPKRNPYCACVGVNMVESFMPSHKISWNGLCESQITSDYCEDWMQYRNLDLLPTVMSMAERESKQDEIRDWFQQRCQCCRNQAQKQCHGGECKL